MADFEWTDESRQDVIDKYVASNPTPETSTEIVKTIAEGLGVTTNGVIAILVRANKYVKKAAAKSTAASGNGAKRVSKADEIQRLKDVIANNELTVDGEIIDKLTGKAAKYFADTFTKLTVVEE